MTDVCTCCEERESAPGKLGEWCGECVNDYVEDYNE